MQQNQNYNNDQKDNQGRAGVAEPNERQPKAGRKPSAADDARQMLDEIAGLGQEYRANRPPRPDLARTLRTIALSPIFLVKVIVGLVVSLFQRSDFRLANEMRKFLKHPGHFFWFNRIAPERAAEHFGTTSTDAMTHHARRYGAHAAMLILAVIVVFFGGFSGLATKLMSAYADLPSGSEMDKNSTIIEDGRDIYVSAIAGNVQSMPHRTEVIVVKDGETLRSIAANRGLSLETLLWANAMIDPDTEIKGGQKLIIPPTTGMLHIANKGDTVAKIAERYGVEPKVILSYKFNNLDGADETTPLKELQEVMVPGGSMPQRDKIYMYTVRSGDTIKKVADKFGLKSDTLLDNNGIDNGLLVGQEIRILPVDGILYTVKSGDSLNGVASYLGTSPDNIINFRPNNVARNVPLITGASLIVPGGSWPPPPPPVEEVVPVAPAPKPAPTAPAAPRQNNQQPVAPPAKQLTNPTTTKTQTPVQKPAPQVKPAAPGQVAVQNPAPARAVQIGSVSAGSGVGSGSFIWPIHGIITTYFGQPIWYGIHMGLDIATACGTPTVASDGGTVVLSGWDGGYGNSVVIDHGGGFKTRYGHFMSQPPVRVGQRVAKGQLIGYEGTTGASTGCHVHFEVLVNGAYTDPLRWLR